MNRLRHFFSWKNLLSLGLGLLGGLFLHYLVYRISLPSEPFIYVAF